MQLPIDLGPFLEAFFIILFALIVTALTWLHYARARSGHKVARRALPALNVLRAALGRGAETGRAIHVSPGAGTIGNRATTAETIAGLLAAEQLARQAALNGAPVLVSSGDAVSHLALRGTLRQAYQNAGQAQDYKPQNIELLAHQDTAAYATGVMTLYARQQLEASQLLGSFSQEFLLCGEDGAQRGIPQVAGATSMAALPVILLSAQDTLIGEEIFAAEAYLSDDAASDARLRTQDVLRMAAIVLIVGGLVYTLLIQPLLALTPLPGF
jgi:hypothetical protein